MKNIKTDVCIITDLSLSGGSTFSTIEEVDYFNKHNVANQLIHCPKKVNAEIPLDKSYKKLLKQISTYEELDNIECNVLIVRHPKVICSPYFTRISPKIKSKFLLAVVNESMYSVRGLFSFSLADFFKNFISVNSEQKKIFPISNSIRAEFANLPSFPSSFLSDFNWAPTFDTSKFNFRSKPAIQYPINIGCHCRDVEEKWLDSKEKILSIYPNSDHYKISILGGADYAMSIIGNLPNNWNVLPFGSISPNDYLQKLDIFVFFPHEKRNEAFGRTIAEAMLCGVPCILPLGFESNFEHLAFYSEVANVEKVMQRLASSPENLAKFLSTVRDIVIETHDTKLLGEKLSFIVNGSLQKAKNRAISQELIDFKKWVETGI